MPRDLWMKVNFLLLFLLIISLISFYVRLFPRGYEISLLITVDLVATIPVVISAINALKNKKVTVDLLASIALFVSLIHREWASVAFIGLMITSARIFGIYTEGKADSAIKSILKLRPERVKVKKGRELLTLPIERVKLGDIVVVEAGDRIPVDGIIIEGNGSIDQSSLTGESFPVTRIKGQRVFSSTLNLSGSFLMKTEKIGEDTTFEKIVALIQNAQEDKKGIQGIADRFATFYIVITLCSAIVIYTITQDLNLILSILLVACADDIAVAIPMAFWGAIAKAGRHGIIIKGSEYLEGLSDLQTVLMDKTGTITKGVPGAEKIICFNGFKAPRALSLFAEVESVSEHPIAKAIIKHAQNDGIKIRVPSKFEEVAGLGIKVMRGKEKIVAGNLKFLEKEKVRFKTSELKIAYSYQNQGYGVVYLGVNRKLAAIFTLADQIRPEAKSTISSLRSLGVKRIIMLTGDSERVAERVSKEVGIEEFHAGLLPEDKLNYIRNFAKNTKGKLAMVGDGVNDAAALKLSDIGVAMGAIGTDSAIEAADIALMQDNLGKIIQAIKISRFTREISRENFAIWGAVNIFGLFLVLTGTMGPTGAAAYNFVTDFFPIFNALRVFRYKIS